MLRLTRQDLSNMEEDPTQWFDVTITEILEQVVRVEAHSPEEAEQSIARDWRRREIVLDAGNFIGVELRPCLLMTNRINHNRGKMKRKL